jgi:hypothetical protein
MPLSRLHECAQDIVHEGLVTLAVRPEPLQDIVVNADIDMVFASGDSHNGLHPLWFTAVIDVGADRRF